MNRIADLIEGYISHPVPFWNDDLSKALVSWQIQSYRGLGLLKDDRDYNTRDAYLQQPFTETAPYQDISNNLRIELPEQIALGGFYIENGLDLLNPSEYEKLGVVSQINESLSLLDQVIACGRMVRYSVKCFQILKQIEPEFDVSYSHPTIPFSVFVSVGKKNDELDTIRLAESILHETMHLILTLIEKHVNLVEDNSQQYFSPWREEKRPLRGVLHGMFVFRYILEFYKGITTLTSQASQEFKQWRIEQITSEIKMLEEFPNCQGLTPNGATLSTNLLP